MLVVFSRCYTVLIKYILYHASPAKVCNVYQTQFIDFPPSFLFFRLTAFMLCLNISRSTTTQTTGSDRIISTEPPLYYNLLSTSPIIRSPQTPKLFKISTHNSQQSPVSIGSSLSNAPTAAAGVNGANINNGTSASANGNHNGHNKPCAGERYHLSTYKHESPEIHDLIRFEHAIMQKYRSTRDQHFKNIAEALRPQIEEKIRAYDSCHHRN